MRTIPLHHLPTWATKLIHLPFTAPSLFFAIIIIKKSKLSLCKHVVHLFAIAIQIYVFYCQKFYIIRAQLFLRGICHFVAERPKAPQ